MFLNTSNELLIIDFTTCSIYAAHVTWLLMNCTSFSFHFRPHFSFLHLITHTTTPEGRHILFQPITTKSPSSDLSYSQVTPCNYSLCFSTWLPLNFLLFTSPPHLTKNFSESSFSLTLSPRKGRMQSGQEGEGRRWRGPWHPQLETYYAFRKASNPPSSHLPHLFSFSSCLWFFILTPYLYNLVNLSKVWCDYVKEDC